MSRKYFGTDGIRGVANVDLTPELALRLGFAAGTFLRESVDQPRVVIGRDTRRSGPMLGAALAAGFCSAGAEVSAMGVAPTPAISYVARARGFSMGAVVSASHNPAPDNGIKLLGHDGRKLSDEDELKIEVLLGGQPSHEPRSGDQVGLLNSGEEGMQAYESFVSGIVAERLEGMRIAVDCANGAAFDIAPRVLESLGAEVVAIGVEPDGMNINAVGGATKPGVIQQFTLDSGADVGIAFDGDADRAVLSDEKGRLINGDRMLAGWAVERQERNCLDPEIVVGTVMSNMGMERYLADRGIALERAPVGDKYVAQRLEATGAEIGGEQSGHIIFPEHGPTGDGLVTALQMLAAIRRMGRRASWLADAYEAWPQVLVNVRLADRNGWETRCRTATALREGAARLEGIGRLVVRASGTQPMVRVMVEADQSGVRDAVADDIVGALSEESGGEVYSRVDLTHALGD